jgi:hypothetical protein
MLVAVQIMMNDVNNLVVIFSSLVENISSHQVLIKINRYIFEEIKKKETDLRHSLRILDEIQYSMLCNL